MNPKTAELFNRLESAEFFTAVGQQDGGNWCYATSWMEAVAECVSSKWSNCHTELINDLRMDVRSKAMDRYQTWNSVVTNIRPIVSNLVERKALTQFRVIGLPEKIAPHLTGILLTVVLSYEYSNISLIRELPERIAAAVLAGHFPCGWEGEFPDGRLIVY